MGGQSDETDGAIGARATIHIRCSNGTKFLVEVALTSTVGAFKFSLVEKSEIPVDQQRLIYKGRVLKDDHSLGSYGLQDHQTVHLVRGAPSLVSSGTATNTATTTLPGSAGGFPATTSVARAEGSPPVSTGSPGFGIPDFQQVQEQLTQNPNLMRDMMNMPAFQGLISNPELMRSLIMSNPQMRDIIDRNPDLAHVLNDPGTLRQSLDAARNPELMREMMRNTDRAMSNIESSPEGFNMLRRMYETVQEPLLNAATMGSDGAGDRAVNPFGMLLGVQSPTENQVQASESPASATLPVPNLNLATATAVPNTAPLPNPWNYQRALGGGSAVGETIMSTNPANAGLLGLLGQSGHEAIGPGSLEFRGSVEEGFGLGSATMQQLLQNPTVLQMMQGLLSNPQYVNQVLSMQPHLRSMLISNPQFREMVESPGFLQHISNPESLQQMFQLQQALLDEGQGRSPVERTQAQLREAGNTAGLDLNSLYNMLGAFGSSLTSNADGGRGQSSEQLFASQLLLLQDMGFTDTEENIRALTATGGDVHAAVEWLLGNSG